jgi:hypothetical protein
MDLTGLGAQSFWLSVPLSLSPSSSSSSSSSYPSVKPMRNRTDLEISMPHASTRWRIADTKVGTSYIDAAASSPTSPGRQCTHMNPPLLLFLLFFFVFFFFLLLLLLLSPRSPRHPTSPCPLGAFVLVRLSPEQSAIGRYSTCSNQHSSGRWDVPANEQLQFIIAGVKFTMIYRLSGSDEASSMG